MRENKEQILYYLTTRDCAAALKLAQSTSFLVGDADAYSLMASAYACFAGHDDIAFLTNSISSIDSASLIGSLASLDSSNETTADSDDYTNYQLAINTILSSTTTSGAAARIATYGANDASDLNFQLLFLLMVQLGKYFAFYGNASATGVKGGGALGNNCLYTYQHPDAIAFVNSAVPTGSCANPITANSAMAQSVDLAIRKRRLCEGIILFNNFLDVLANLDVSNNQFGDLSNIGSAFDALYLAAETAETSTFSTNVISTVKTILDQSTCEAEDVGVLERYHAFFFESVFQ